MRRVGLVAVATQQTGALVLVVLVTAEDEDEFKPQEGAL